jgi:spermidine/putrescine transport system ATP-binding protein
MILSTEDASAVPDVELRGVTKHYGEVLASDNVSLQVRKGEFFSLLGPSGCGKTTCLRMIAGFEDPDSGTVHLRGKVVNDVPPYRRAIGMVFQNLALFPHMNVFKNIAFGLKMKGMSPSRIRKRVTQMLGVVGLEGIERRRIDQLSGGQQQRVALARALITDPAVLLLDEPLGALDLKLRLQMQTELRRVHTEVGTTFIFVTHDQGEAMAMSDRIAVMSKGSVQQVGTPVDIYRHPQNSFVADFIGETNLLEGRLVQSDLVDVDGIAIRVNRQNDIPSRRVRISIRPEDVHLAMEPLGTANTFDGVVERLTYKGARVTVQVRVRDIVVRAEAAASSVAGLRDGRGVVIGWDPSDAIVLEI